MASKNKIIEIIYGIKTIYPYYAKETDVDSLVRTWGLLLRDIDDAVADEALFRALRVCKMPPTPADIIDQVNEMRAANMPTPEELWLTYYNAVRQTMRLVSQFGYTYVDSTGMSQGDQARDKVRRIWEGLPDIIKQYLISQAELIRVAQHLMVASESEMTWEKQRFIKNVPILEKRAEYSSPLLEGSSRLMISEG